ncbi:hypothetical protein [Klebsiella quasipneumoniae]|uniref:hypothetical protein n=1 Tax=Klebsiella quasipneumoniae TaxID=1463165 RepID=UPI003D00B0AE
MGQPELKPDPTAYNPSPDYLRALLASAGVSQSEAARLLRIDPRTMRSYLSDAAAVSRSSRAPYAVQFALESLAK